ncbi:MAG: response regulator, partial [gamma proteobacterium endosymbiont of Lamellibrachia anaximandri]|nr:response regulator [gamma proteobacterium endosymbiont of Lamellibrachia anaximandri]
MTRKCVLIVDDSRTAREVLKKKLISYDVDIDSVESAGTAVDYLVKKLPDAIFMDFEMPGMDGYQTLRVLKSNARTSKIPVMMYTSREEGLTVSQARALGAVGVLPKLMGKQVSLRPRERFWDIPVPKIDSGLRQPVCAPAVPVTGTTRQPRK